MKIRLGLACVWFLLFSIYPEESSTCFTCLVKLAEVLPDSINAIEHVIHELTHHHHDTQQPARSSAPPPPARTTVHRRPVATLRPTTTAAPTPPPTYTNPTSTSTAMIYSATVSRSGADIATTVPIPVSGIVCYSCTGKAVDGSCSAVALCKANEVCAVYRDPSGFTHKCLDANVCSAAKAIVPDRCWQCCSGSLCNQRCAKDTCVDTANCAVMKQAGFTVCADPKLAHTDCKKSCNHCSAIAK